MTQINRTIITVVVLHEGPEPLAADLKDVLYEMDSGRYIGQETKRTTHVVHPLLVPAALEALGNDGSFFEVGDDE